MRARTALVLVAVAAVVAVRFWPDEHTREFTGPSAPGRTSQQDPLTKYSGNPVETPAQKAPVEAAMPSSETPASGTSGFSGTPVQVNVHSPSKVHSGDTFQVTIDMQAMVGTRQIAFAVNYNPTTLELIGSSPGVLAEKSGAAGDFYAEESSDGSLFVRVNLDSGVVVGPGSVAVLEFRARNPGESGLAIHDVNYVESGQQRSSTTPAGYEGKITVD